MALKPLHGMILTLFMVILVTQSQGIMAAVQDRDHEATEDIRIIIDVSGSMKWNDPKNLRAPALRLITGLLPRETHAGVWTFAKFVNMLVPHGEIDRTWKQKAKRAAAKIHSKGLFTDIEAVLETATWNWRSPDNKFKRNIILLTDGLVDISKDDIENERSRSRILGSILPRLKRANVTINTIALSAEADDVLLQQLAAATNGWFEKADTAENLERLFFRMFEQTTEPDTLPLIDNEVLVDDSIEELTLLIFRKENAPPSRIILPDGTVFGQENTPANVNWYQEDRYDLITVVKPDTGNWKVDAEVDPDNRVMVVTNLRMITTRLPNNISLGDDYTLFVRLINDDKTIEQTDFLHFIKVSLTQQQKGGERWEWSLLDNGLGIDERRDDGTYSIHLDETLVTGRHILTVDVDGTTFKRTHSQIVNVYDSPVVAAIRSAMINEEEHFSLSIIPRAGMINPETTEIVATISGPDAKHTSTVPLLNDNEWRLDLDEYPSDSRHQVDVEIIGEKPNGRPLNIDIGPLYFGEDIEPLEEEEADTTEATIENVTEVVEVSDETPESINWLVVIIEVLFFNIILGAGIFFGQKKLQNLLNIEVNPWDDLAHE